ncbi:MAG: hypothetical protein J6B23_04365 [Clostridia bacterium]|nr:hypothetical protein [Clostridia bacterium]
MTGRHEIVAFMGVKEGETVVYKRMRNFEEMSTSRNPEKYEVKYVDEKNKRSHVTSFAVSTSYKFDYDPQNPVHNTIVDITELEKTNEDAVVEIVTVKLTDDDGSQGSTFKAFRRKFTVTPNTDGDDANVMKYSGSFDANGELEIGTATTEDEWDTAVFVADE